MAVLMTRRVSSGHMSLPRRVLVVLLVVIAALVAVIAYRTATYTPPTGERATPVDLAPVVRIDATLGARVFCRGGPMLEDPFTIAVSVHAAGADVDQAAW